MMNKGRYDILKQIIDLYERYEGDDKTPDLLSFAHWIINKYDSEPEITTHREKERMLKNHNSGTPVYKTMNTRSRFLELIAGIARYHEFYTRKALRDIEINSRMEYLFLQTVALWGRSKKTDLISTFHTEYTTGMDTIRRLLKNGLLNEAVNENDKRSRMLELTGKGAEVLKKANRYMDDEARIILSATDDNKWKKAMFALEEINDFHHFVYENHSSKTFAEISNLMDSLKREW